MEILESEILSFVPPVCTTEEIVIDRTIEIPLIFGFPSLKFRQEHVRFQGLQTHSNLEMVLKNKKSTKEKIDNQLTKQTHRPNPYRSISDLKFDIDLAYFKIFGAMLSNVNYNDDKIDLEIVFDYMEMNNV